MMVLRNETAVHAAQATGTPRRLTGTRDPRPQVAVYAYPFVHCPTTSLVPIRWRTVHGKANTLVLTANNAFQAAVQGVSFSNESETYVANHVRDGESRSGSSCFLTDKSR